MLSKFIENKILHHFSFDATADQQHLISVLGEFVASQNDSRIMVVNGYAGTGKTSIISALAKTFKEMKIEHFMLAPTGRAAKVMNYYSGYEALTIHKKIYRQKSVTQEGFVLDFNKTRDAFFIIDEASMISTSSYENNIFGSGNLLEDLFNYVSLGENGKIIFIGDKAQLPPIGSDLSPALDINALSVYGKVNFVEMRQVVRQNKDSGVLFNATACRLLIEQRLCKIPKFDLSYPDFKRIGGEDFIETLEDAYSKYGQENCIVITRSNKQANRFNQGVRSRILYQEEELDSSDMVMVVKNNYHYSLNLDEEKKDGDFIANGDIAMIRRVRRYQELYGCRFIDATLRFPDSDDTEIDCKLLLDTLSADTPSLSSQRNKELFYAVEEDYAYIPTKRERYKKMKQDPFLNALQIKFAYAVTCHKAQGGQWDAVFIDRMLWSSENMSVDLLRWLYTAITRAKKEVYLLNFPDDFFCD
ncbi:MAG: AAA family ATPase [Bacteroidetes bacterium]|nr:AAA family ATPase [Bacteroidota bacterium]